MMTRMKAVGVALASLVTMTLGMRAAAAADKSDKVVFPQGSEQPLAALTTLWGASIPCIPSLEVRSPSGLTLPALSSPSNRLA